MRQCIRIFALVLASLAPPVWAESHALIMTIGAYINGVTPLVGSQYDVPSARAIANKMGVKDQNIRYYKDGQLTLVGMRRAFDDLYQRVAENDSVFIYYSGHGGRSRVSEQDSRCAAALVAVDGEWFMDNMVQSELTRLATKARKVVMFADACHSGGVKTRSLSTPLPEGIAPRFWAKQGPDSCEIPVNVVTNNLRTQARSVGKGGNNVVYIAAAQENEVSWDMGKTGGAATQSWRECITGGAQDRDQSGGLSATEIQQCAQAKMNLMFRGMESQGILPSHVTVAGNSSTVLAFVERASQPPAAPPAPTRPPASTLTTKPPATPTTTEAARPAPPAFYTLRDVYSNRDDRRVVRLAASKPRFQIGKDDVAFSLTSSHPGYVYLLMVGSDGKTFDMIFPNKLDEHNEIGAGQTLQLPRPAWQIKAAGPAGRDYLLAIVADAPRDFSRTGMRAAGPFSVVNAAGSASHDIQFVSNTAAAANSAECSAPAGSRTLEVKKRCSNAYGAALIAIEEVN